VFFTLFLTGTTFNIQSYIGMVMLAGIVVNNAIVLVDYVNLMRRRDGMPLIEAVVESGRRRLRPILMTTSDHRARPGAAGHRARRGRGGPGARWRGW
jgi:multidrug efflux pump subunit AcrB